MRTDTAAFNITTPFGTIYSAWYDHYMAPGVFKVLETDCTTASWSRSGPDRAYSTSVAAEGITRCTWPTSGRMSGSSAWICRRS